MRNQKGFTMVELIVIVAVIAILGGILTPMVIKEIGKSKITRASADMEAVSTAFTQYYVDTGFWPEKYDGSKNRRAALRAYDCFYDNTKNLSGWDGPYLEKGTDKAGKRVVANKNGTTWEGIVDPWGQPFRVIYGKAGGATVGGAISVVCAGPNGKFDTSDADALLGDLSKDDVGEIVTSRVGF